MSKIYAAWLFVGRVKKGALYYQNTRGFVVADDYNEAKDKAVEKLSKKLIVEKGDFVDLKVEKAPDGWYTLNPSIEEISNEISEVNQPEEYPEVSIYEM
jgi:hypothetical protein